MKLLHQRLIGRRFASTVVSALPSAHDFEVVVGLLLVHENVRRNLDPGLRAACPDVGDWFEPAGVVECAGLECDNGQIVDFTPDAATAGWTPAKSVAAEGDYGGPGPLFSYLT